MSLAGVHTVVTQDNNKPRAAELLRISLKTLHNKLRLYREHGLLPLSGDGRTTTRL